MVRQTLTCLIQTSQIKPTLPLDTYRQTQDIEQSQPGFYVQDEMKWQDWTVVAGLRHDKFKSTLDRPIHRKV